MNKFIELKMETIFLCSVLRQLINVELFVSYNYSLDRIIISVSTD